MATTLLVQRDSFSATHSQPHAVMDKVFRRFSSKKSQKSSSHSNSISSNSPAPARVSPITLARETRDMSNPFTTTLPTRRRPAPEAPPPYSPPENNSNVSNGTNSGDNSNNNHTVPFSPADLSTTMQTGDDSPYAFLRTFDTIFLIDDSGSMAGRSWRETAAALAAIAPVCTAHDPDGIDVYFLNHRNPHASNNNGGYTNITTTTRVQNLFQTVRPLGGTPTGTRLNQILRPYLAEVAESMERVSHGHEPTVKPLNIIVVTDGVPSDDVESVIVSAARKLDSMNAEPWQVGIQFFQVGREPEAREMLTDLDDALSSAYHIRDMVDTVPWNGDEADSEGLTAQGLLKVCLGSVVRRWDRRSV